jgi:hypothetical protein
MQLTLDPRITTFPPSIPSDEDETLDPNHTVPSTDKGESIHDNKLSFPPTKTPCIDAVDPKHTGPPAERFEPAIIHLCVDSDLPTMESEADVRPDSKSLFIEHVPPKRDGPITEKERTVPKPTIPETDKWEPIKTPR